METTAYYAFGVPIYLAIVVLEALRARQKNRAALSFAPSFGNVTAGLGSIVVGLFLGPALLLLYSFALRHFALIHWENGSVLTWVLALVLADFGHYWHHRVDHRVAACWAVHGVHHMPEEMNFTVAMRHAWFSDLYSFPFYAPLPLLGVPTEQFFIATTLLSFHALITHSAEYDFPSFGFLVTPSSHVLHHAKNAPYIDKNFGAMLCIWDRIFGTHVKVDPARPAVYGTTRGYATHAGTRAQWVLWADLVRLVRRARSFREGLRVVFGRPGTTPEDVAPPGDGALPAIAPPPSPTAITLKTKLYVAAQLVLTVAFSLWVFILREEHSWPVTLASSIAITWAMASLGAVLDGRERAWTWEKSRILISGAAVGAAALFAFH